MKERILQLIQSEQLNSSRFADIIGVQRSSVSHIISGRNNPSMDFIQKILKAFPSVNADWLLLGKGEMYSKDTEPTIFSMPVVSSKDDQMENEDPVKPVSPIHPPEKSNIQQESQDPKQSDHPERDIKETKSEKSIEKIVIFFKDKTFIEYKPE